MDVYFEKLTLANWLDGLLYRLRGRPVYYFEVGRFFNRFSWIALLLRPFRKAEYHVSDYQGLSLEIHRVVLEAAESLYQQLAHDNGRVLDRWQGAFRSDRVHLYVKKYIALFAWSLVRDYLVLSQRARRGGPKVRLVVLDDPLNRLLLPLLRASYPAPGLEVGGLRRAPWRHLSVPAAMGLNATEYFLRLLWLVWRRPFARQRPPQRYKVSKEILWGIGLGRRNDDFLVDGEAIRAKDMLFYYRHGSSRRAAWPGSLQASIANARDRGYDCVNFERAPITMELVRDVILPRYVLFPLATLASALASQVRRRSAPLLNQIALAFSAEAVGWEVFLASYRPRLNLSFDDPYPGDIAATAALNLHGSENGGVQWGDSSWRSMTLAYLGQNVYFSWGALQEKFWKGNWRVDRIIPTGYVWGHHFLESLDAREALRASLLGNGRGRKFVLAMFDEPPSPETHKSEKTVYDFYRIAVELMERRPDLVVIARPKRVEGVSGGPAVRELIAPYLASGRLVIWDRKTTDATQVIAVSDVVVSMEMSAPCLEAICCGRRAFNFTPTQNYPSPIYHAGRGTVFLERVDALVDAISHALDHPEEDPRAGLQEIMDDVDPYRDFRGIERIRNQINEMAGELSPSGRQESSPSILEAGQVFRKDTGVVDRGSRQRILGDESLVGQAHATHPEGTD